MPVGHGSKAQPLHGNVLAPGRLAGFLMITLSLFVASTAILLLGVAQLQIALPVGFIARFGVATLTPRWLVRLGMLPLCVAFLLSAPGNVERLLWLASVVALVAEAAYALVEAKSDTRAPLSTAQGAGNASRVIALVVGLRVPALAAAGRWLERLRPAWVALLMSLFIFGEGRFLVPGLAGVVLLWTVTGLGTGVWGPRLTVALLPFGLMALLPLSWSISTNLALSREHTGYLLAELLALYTVATWALTMARLVVAARVLVGLGVVLTLTAPFALQPDGSGFLAALPVVRKVAALLPNLVQKNVLGGALATFFPLAFGLFLYLRAEGSNRRAALLAFCAAAFIFLGIVASQSRGALLAAVVSLAVVAALRWRPVRIALPVAAAVVLSLAALRGQGSVLSEVLKSDSVGDLAVRVEIWSRAAQAIGDYPITGLGIGTFRSVVPALYPYVQSDPAKVHHAHNLFLQVASDLGLPGLSVFLALVAAFLFGGLRTRRSLVSSQSSTAWIVAGAIGALAAMLTHGLLDAVTWGTRTALLSWAVLGLLGAAVASEPAPSDSTKKATYPWKLSK